jgi:hypothetical protein
MRFLLPQLVHPGIKFLANNSRHDAFCLRKGARMSTSLIRIGSESHKLKK